MGSGPASLAVRCPAKLNLFLEVVRRRPDGYHDIDTIMQAIDLYDDLAISPRPGPELTLECSDPRLPSDEQNLALRAAIALRQATGCRLGAHLRLIKRIPSQAGLGGGSSDAAGALAGLNRAWGTGLPTEELRRIAATVGSDVAFFLYGGAAHCTGRGELVEPLQAAAELHYVLVCPNVSVATPEAYRKLRFPLTPARPSASIMACQLARGDAEGIGASVFNRLEGAAFALHPTLAQVKSRLEATGLFAAVGMTGSGSALFGLCRAGEHARARECLAALQLGDTYGVRSIREGVTVSLTE